MRPNIGDPVGVQLDFFYQTFYDVDKFYFSMDRFCFSLYSTIYKYLLNLPKREMLLLQNKLCLLIK